MGYVLPIHNIQASLYANRMAMESHNFTYIHAVGPVKMKSDFDDELERKYRQNEEVKRELLDDAPPVPFKGFIQPNPVNLSPDIAKVSGKGKKVNTYV